MSIRFDNLADNFFRDTNLPSITSFTIMVWARWVSLDGTWDGVINFGQNVSSNYYYMGISPDLANRFCLVSPIGVVADAGFVPVAGQWYHLCMTVAGTGTGQFLGYIDGVLRMTADGNGTPTNARLSIGNNPDSDWANVDIFSVKIWNRVLTAAEIQNEMWDITPIAEGINSFAPLWNVQDATTEYSFGRHFTTAGTLTSIVDNPPGVKWGRTRRKIYLPNDQEAPPAGSSQLGAFDIGGTHHMSPRAASLLLGSYRLESPSNISQQSATNRGGTFIGTANSHIETRSAKTTVGIISVDSSSNLFSQASNNKLSSSIFEGRGDVASFARRLILGSVETGDAIYTEGLVAVDRLGIVLLEGDSHIDSAAGISSRGTILFPGNSDLYVSSLSSVAELGAFELLGRADLNIVASILSRGGISLAGMSDFISRGASQQRGSISQGGSSILLTDYLATSLELGSLSLDSNASVLFQAAVARQGGLLPVGSADLYVSALPNISELGGVILENSSFLGMAGAVSKMGALQSYGNSNYANVMAAVSKGGVFIPDGRSDIYFNSTSSISELGATELFGSSNFAIVAAVAKGGVWSPYGQSDLYINGSTDSSVAELGLFDLLSTSHLNIQAALVKGGSIVNIGGTSYLLFNPEPPPTTYPSFVPLKIVYLTMRV